MKVIIGGDSFYTDEVIEDDGTYGDSAPNVYWFDANDIEHVQYINGGSIIHISDQPLPNMPRAKLDISSKAAPETNTSAPATA